MTLKPCPTCKGNCCGYTFDLRHEDGHKGNPFHYCPDCDDGTCDIRPTPTTEPTRTYDEGVADERAAVVVWLRSEEPHRVWADSIGGSEYACAADVIERGEHLKEKP